MEYEWADVESESTDDEIDRASQTNALDYSITLNDNAAIQFSNEDFPNVEEWIN